MTKISYAVNQCRTLGNPLNSSLYRNNEH